MNEKNKKFNVELHINIKSYINEFKDLFLVSSTKEIFSKKFLFTQQNKDSFIISYPNINNKNISNASKETTEIISSQKLKELIKIFPLIKIISYIKYDETKNSFYLCNAFKHQKELNIINQGDIIKLGYISLKFDKIFFAQEKNDDKSSYGNINIIQEKKVSFSSKSSSNENEKFCRICFQKGSGPFPGNRDRELDPLISVCKCIDSMKYVHLSCLKNKINLNIYKKYYKHHDIYLFQNYNCDICLSTYPKYIIIDNKKLNLLDIDVSNYDNYAIFDMIKF